MDSLEKCAFNVKQEIEDYGKQQYELGKEDAESNIDERLEKEYDQGFEDGQEEMEDDPSEKQMLEFAIGKMKDAIQRGITGKQLLIELESEYCTHIPTIGLSIPNQTKLI